MSCSEGRTVCKWTSKVRLTSTFTVSIIFEAFFDSHGSQSVQRCDWGMCCGRCYVCPLNSNITLILPKCIIWKKLIHNNFCKTITQNIAAFISIQNKMKCPTKYFSRLSIPFCKNRRIFNAFLEKKIAFPVLPNNSVVPISLLFH